MDGEEESMMFPSKKKWRLSAHTNRMPDSVVLWSGWIASILSISAAIGLAVLPHPHPAMKWFFLDWTISNTLWSVHAVGKNSGSLLASQLIFLAIDFIGMTHWWIGI